MIKCWITNNLFQETILRWEFYVISVSGPNPVVCEERVHMESTTSLSSGESSKLD